MIAVGNAYQPAIYPVGRLARSLDQMLRCTARPLNELLLYTSIGITLCFAFVNGFHDGGNVIATIVCSRSMRPFKALVLASIAEFVGPLVLGTAVARTMASSILKPDLLEQLSPGTVYLMIISGVGGP